MKTFAWPHQDKEPRGIIPLENLSIREVEDSKKPVSARQDPARLEGHLGRVGQGEPEGPAVVAGHSCGVMSQHVLILLSWMCWVPHCSAPSPQPGVPHCPRGGGCV